ncbi:testis-expressed protein 264 homolog [Brachyhypopomus gauderio]|uniref:testis-expressed protein 264 homolog n=1 Tax=Brachyhypopomus gauderio TaxID=698409 RepID=UPI004041DE21
MDILTLSVIGILLISLLLTCYVVYSGLLTTIHIGTGSPPIRSITVAYKYKEGPYKECGMLFSESYRIAPRLPTVGIFYDDPQKVPGPKCRCVVGSVLSEGDEALSPQLQQLYEKSGFQIFTFPEVTHVVSACFPHRTPLSVYLGVQRVYPRLACYIKERKLCAHPFLEIYKDQQIHYMGPLARQGDFYVPEVREAPRRPQEGEESEEERRTDISGADSNSECSSVSYPLPSDSRDPSPALSVTQDHDQHRDSGPLGHDDWAVGRHRRPSSSSASSFEDLDVEKDGVISEKRHTPDHPTHNHPQEQRMVVEGEE